MSHHQKTMIWGGYFLGNFWYKIHLPPSRFFSTTIGISRILFPQLFSSKINSLGLTIFLRDSDMFSRGREIITFWWFSNLLFHWIYFYQFCSSRKITQYTFTRKELANPSIIPKFNFWPRFSVSKSKIITFWCFFFRFAVPERYSAQEAWPHCRLEAYAGRGYDVARRHVRTACYPPSPLSKN